jgi:acyl-coenzyme A thioesterase PaaI-like protein
MTADLAPTQHLPPFTARLVTYLEAVQPGRCILQFRVEAHHCGADGLLHPGMLGTFADGLFGRVVRSIIGAGSVTQRLDFDVLDEIRTGDDLRGEAWLERQEGVLLFVAGRAAVGPRPVMRAGGIFTQVGRENRLQRTSLSR